MNSSKSDKIKVLVIDDDKNQRNMLAFALSDRGYLIVAVESGERAIQEAESGRFDLAICDIMMPGLGGVETLKRLRELQPAMGVVMATGYATAETALKSMKLGAVNYLAKPYELKDLLAVLEQALGHGPAKPS
ncbi:MAG: response regulator [Elusimicrobia bacterium]|nr:response regulator [Elusimicrobiota bacterium]